MEKKPCLLHIWPHWPSALFALLPFALTVLLAFNQPRLSIAMVLGALISILLSYFTCQSLSFYPDQLVLRCVGIPIQRIPLEKVAGVVLIPAHHSGRHEVPPTVAVIPKPGTIDRYCSECGLIGINDVNCPHISTRFNARQEYAVWAAFESNGIPVEEFEDVLYRG